MIWLSSQKSQLVAIKADKDRKIGHRRVDDAGHVTYKRVSTCCFVWPLCIAYRCGLLLLTCGMVCLSVCVRRTHTDRQTMPHVRNV